MMYRYILGYYYNCTRPGLGLSNAGVMLGMSDPLYISLLLCPPLLLTSSTVRNRVSLNQLVIFQCVHLIVS